ncbi:outer membrane beta-barrel protein [Legionella erythra]|uniref:Outer membrane protein beta-barrel domain-containing protein n=1 Tax=Legionella erythra TaxID=448 RepID=A0A0W0TUI9_LEGER|nr:outer membrane beta-barrel protein [Legionella erythra]KTC99377.1 hypothetical protein Lery_0278 [Legionella erythra]
MKKIITTGVASCLILASFSVVAEDVKPEGWYVKGSYENLFYNNAFKSLSWNTKDPAFGASLGYKYGRLRGEGKYSFQHLSSLANAHLFSVNGYFDFDNQTFFSPYVGLGVGKTAFTQVKHGYRISSDVLPVAYVGTRAYLNQNVALDLGYQASLNHLSSSKGSGSVTLGLAVHF